jgi:hypothetical protein
MQGGKSMSISDPVGARPLRPGDLVEVRPAAEILATLDVSGALDMMPFMPEMARHAGRRYKVSRRVDKICDTIGGTGSRRMYATVYLEDLRCNGSHHGGCQAGCKIYWKEAWLRRVDDATTAVHAGDAASPTLEQLTQTCARTVRELDGVRTDVWRCQATDALKASERLRGYDLRQYWRELTNGNYRPFRFARLLARGFVMKIASSLGLLKPLPLKGLGPDLALRQPLGLKRGDFVQVRSPGEIAATLDGSGLNDGLSFDREMLPFCGRTLRVKDRVQKIIDDKTGRMLNIRKDCLILDGAVCSGERSINRCFCPREIHAYWREAWLRPVEEPQSQAPARPSEQGMPRVGNS